MSSNDKSASPVKSTGLHVGEIKPGVAKKDPILIADGVRRQFGGLTAVDVAHVEIPRHAITALIGPNGAGKTTFFNLLTGFDTPNEGTWSFNGKSLAGVPAFKVARMGLIRTFQLTKALGLLTVLDNITLAPRVVKKQAPQAAREVAREVLAKRAEETSEQRAAETLSLANGERDRIIAAMQAIVPGEGVITQADALRPWESDGLTAYRQRPLLVALPETYEQVQAVLKTCHALGVPVVPDVKNTYAASSPLTLGKGGAPSAQAAAAAV